MYDKRRRLAAEITVSVDGAHCLAARLVYSASDPYVVAVVVSTRTWHLDRHLLSAGLSVTSGTAEVQAWPSWTRGLRVLCVSVRGVRGRCRLEIGHESMAAFLDATGHLVPFGGEGDRLDLDAELARLLA